MLEDKKAKATARRPSRNCAEAVSRAKRRICAASIGEDGIHDDHGAARGCPPYSSTRGRLETKPGMQTRDLAGVVTNDTPNLFVSIDAAAAQVCVIFGHQVVRSASVSVMDTFKPRSLRTTVSDSER
jgi:hypothetical protein